MKKTALWIFVLLISVPMFAQGEIWSNLDKGNYTVGFKVFSLFDSTRTINNPKGYRPVQVSMWYPAKTSDAASMIYKDYFLLSAAETDYKISEALKDSVVIRYKRLLSQNGISEKFMDEWFNSKMLATKNTKSLKGKFPLVVVAQGNFHSAHHQSFLCEFLASNGYVVVTTPSQTRITGQLTEASQAVESANDQVKDMEFAINSLKNFNNIDFNNIALLGHSFGGRSIQLLQMKNKNVKCLISLDGGLGLNTAVDDIKNSPDFNSEKMNVPLLHFYEDTETLMTPDFRLIDSYTKSKRFLVKISDMHHFYFSSLGLVSEILDGFHPTSKNTGKKYKIICEFTRDFLNSVFKSDDTDMMNLRNEFYSFAADHNFISYEFK